MFLKNFCVEIDKKIVELEKEKKDNTNSIENWDQVKKLSGMDEYREKIK
jgi:hypothetical protein